MKQFRSCFSKEVIKKALKEAAGGVHIVLKATTWNEVILVAVGYCYSHKTILHFVLTKNAGNASEGDPYEMKYTNSYGNICIHYVGWPEIISNFFAF